MKKYFVSLAEKAPEGFSRIYPEDIDPVNDVVCFFSESIAIGKDDHVYTVAWVEVCNPEKRKALAEARASGPAETSGMIYEMLLVRLPKWQQFVEGKKG